MNGIVRWNELEFQIRQLQVLNVVRGAVFEDEAPAASSIPHYVHFKCFGPSAETVAGHPSFFVQHVGDVNLPRILETMWLFVPPNHKEQTLVTTICVHAQDGCDLQLAVLAAMATIAFQCQGEI